MVHRIDHCYNCKSNKFGLHFGFIEKSVITNKWHDVHAYSAGHGNAGDSIGSYKSVHYPSLATNSIIKIVANFEDDIFQFIENDMLRGQGTLSQVAKTGVKNVVFAVFLFQPQDQVTLVGQGS